MEKQKIITKRILIAAIICSALFVCGIPIFIVAVVNGIWWLFGIFVGCVAVCFYATPLLWINYGTQKRRLNILSAISHESLYDINALADRFSMKPQLMTNEIKFLLSHSILVGFMVVDGKLVPIKKPTVEITECLYCGTKINDSSTIKCPNCGASVVTRKHEIR